jgi:hypothetical protein
VAGLASGYAQCALVKWREKADASNPYSSL